MFEGVSCEFELIRLLTNEARGGTSLERSLYIPVHKNHRLRLLCSLTLMAVFKLATS